MTTRKVILQSLNCGKHAWEALQKRGRSNGWKPKGTVREDTLGSENPVMGDYRPGEWSPDPYFLFTSADGRGLALALEQFLKGDGANISYPKIAGPRLFSDDMSMSSFKHINSDLT